MLDPGAVYGDVVVLGDAIADGVVCALLGVPASLGKESRTDEGFVAVELLVDAGWV